MLEMRSATTSDQAPIAEMIRKRDAWMLNRGLPGFGDSIDAMAAQAGDPAFPVWVLTHGGTVMGCTTVFDESPEWCFTPEELQEPALFLASTITAPTDNQHLGCLIAYWALSHAAKADRQWVRRGTFEPALMRYYRDVQGWHLLRELERRGRTSFVMARRAEPQPGLTDLFTRTHHALHSP